MMNESRLGRPWTVGQLLVRQSDSIRSTHPWIVRLEAASLGVLAAFFLVALYVSVNHTQVHPLMIPIAWFSWAASASLLGIVFGLRFILTREVPGVSSLGESQGRLTGRTAVYIGWGIVGFSILTAIFWGVFSYAVVYFDEALLRACINVLASVLGISVLAAIVTSLFRQVKKVR